MSVVFGLVFFEKAMFFRAVIPALDSVFAFAVVPHRHLTAKLHN